MTVYTLHHGDRISYQDLPDTPVQPTNEQAQSNAHGGDIVCSTWKSKLLQVVTDGIEVKCKSCRGIHKISRSQLEAEWAKLDSQSI